MSEHLPKIASWLARPDRLIRLRRYVQFSVRRSLERRRKRRALSARISFLKRRQTFDAKPTILVSLCRDADHPGDYKYNGGIKLLSLWAKLLRSHSYEAYVVTFDGTYESWLIEHQPHIPLAKAREWIAAGKPLKFVTIGLEASAFIDLADRFYYFDAELAWTLTYRSLLDRYLKQDKIRRIGTHSRTQQAWYMANLHRNVALVQEWSDPEYWRPDDAKRQDGLVGFMDEHQDETTYEVDLIESICRRSGAELRFVEVKGSEREVLEILQSCDFFLGMNAGKHALWGEGCPRTQQEAMHAGCVVLAYDVNGNREFMIDGFNGCLVPRGRPDLLAEKLIELVNDLERKQMLRENARHFISTTFVPENRWHSVREFLELDDGAVPETDGPYSQLDRSDIEICLGAPVLLTSGEVRALAQYAARSNGIKVEIGCAFGASSVVLLANSPDDSTVLSIDPFVKDSMGKLSASARACRTNVKRALKILGDERSFGKWTLFEDYSHNVAKQWDREIDLLFIDGDHRLDAVRLDFEDWLPHVKEDGMILLHDSRRRVGAVDGEFSRGWPGPTQLAESLRDRDDVDLVDEVNSLTVWARRG